MHIDHRSYRDQGVELEPTSHLGKAVDEMRARGEYAERARGWRRYASATRSKIEQRPELVFDHLTRRQSTFTRNDMAREVFRYIDDSERFSNLMGRLEGSPELVLLAPEVKGRAERESSRRATPPARCSASNRAGRAGAGMAAGTRHGVRRGQPRAGAGAARLSQRRSSARRSGTSPVSAPSRR